jgi:hypothetical protein
MRPGGKINYGPTHEIDGQVPEHEFADADSIHTDAVDTIVCWPGC